MEPLAIPTIKYCPPWVVVRDVTLCSVRKVNTSSPVTQFQALTVWPDAPIRNSFTERNCGIPESAILSVRRFCTYWGRWKISQILKILQWDPLRMKPLTSHHKYCYKEPELSEDGLRELFLLDYLDWWGSCSVESVGTFHSTQLPSESDEPAQLGCGYAVAVYWKSSALLLTILQENLDLTLGYL